MWSEQKQLNLIRKCEIVGNISPNLMQITGNEALFLSAVLFSKGIVFYWQVKSFSLIHFVGVIITCVLSVNYLRLRSNLKLTIANSKTRRKHSRAEELLILTFHNWNRIFFSLSVHICTDIKLATLFRFSFSNFSLDSSSIAEQKNTVA